jgi:hypothetical protein
MPLGPITNGENGWKFVGPSSPNTRDQAVVDLNGNHVFHISSNPSSSDFGGPYSPSLSASAGESETTAQFDSQLIGFQFKPVNATPDGSRIEVDFAIPGATDRNNFMVVESFGSTGIRIATAEPDAAGNFSPAGVAPNDWRQIASNIDPTVWHSLQLRLTYINGPNNDLINIYLDGNLVGTTTTFENYHDSLGGTHLSNAETYQTNRVIFRAGANSGVVNDPTHNQGFYFDNLTSAVYHSTDGVPVVAQQIAPVSFDGSQQVLSRLQDGTFQVSDVVNDNFGTSVVLGKVGNEWQFSGTGSFGSNAFEQDMILSNATSRQFVVYDISNNQIVNAQVLTNTDNTPYVLPNGSQVVGYGNMTGDGWSDLVTRSNTGVLIVSELRNNQIVGLPTAGAVGLEWGLVGFADIDSSGQQSMILRNSNSGGIEAYKYDNSTGYLKGTSLGTVGTDWQNVGVAQLVQAMASFGASGEAGSVSNIQDPSQQHPVLASSH